MALRSGITRPDRAVIVVANPMILVMRSQPAQSILDYICELKNIREKDYLGLRYQDHNKHRYWVDLSRPVSHIAKQFKSDSLALRLRFRYYPAEPSHLREDVSRRQSKLEGSQI
ncbi:FERM protein [Ancylostoma duodenale]|uniref:FERM protein n=1 Tax=Ancylostoma duodenale TaxID=51022 RepID=A0A0C2GD91_9BILA|nr:FERM protein [Ancylostoma duodenale]